MQPIAAHFYMAISVRGEFLKGPPIAAHCSPLLHDNFSHGVIPEKSSHCSPLQPTLTWQFQSGGLIPEKSSHCSPTLTSFYPLWTNYPHTLTSSISKWLVVTLGGGGGSRTVKKRLPLNRYIWPLKFLRKALGRDGTKYEDKIRTWVWKNCLARSFF